MTKDGYLEGQLLLAMPGMADPRFDRALIYLCSHSEEGAMGLVINQAADNINFEQLMVWPIDSLSFRSPCLAPEWGVNQHGKMKMEMEKIFHIKKFRKNSHKI